MALFDRSGRHGGLLGSHAEQLLHDALTHVEDVGENRVPALLEKRAAVGDAVRWHMIGHLQRNKARRAVLLADEIHSVDSGALLETLERIAGEEQRWPRIWLEVKLVERASRGGLAPAELRALFARAVACEQLEVCGLMTMAAPPAAVDDSRVDDPGQRHAPARALIWPASRSLRFHCADSAFSSGNSSS